MMTNSFESQFAMDWPMFLRLLKEAAFLNFDYNRTSDKALAEGIFEYMGNLNGGKWSCNGYYETALIPPTADFFDNIFQTFEVYAPEELESFLNEKCPEGACGHEGEELWARYKEAKERYENEDEEPDWSTIIDIIAPALREVHENIYIFEFDDENWILETN